MSGKLKYLERRLELIMSEIEREALKQERFGEDKFKNGTVLRWDQNYRTDTHEHTRTYSFVAIKAAGRWYTSGIFQRVAMTWDQLVDKHLQHAVEGSLRKMKDGKAI